MKKPENKNYIKRVTKTAGKAMHDYNMIENKDKILAAFSGGKDSFTMLHILTTRKKWVPVDYEIFPVYVKMNMPCNTKLDEHYIKETCANLGYNLIIKSLKIPEAQKSPCFWCSWNRRKVLFDTCDELGCNKIALGHHKDDITETLLLNLFYHGEFSTMPPKLDFFKGKLKLIRPIAYLEEQQTTRYSIEHGFNASTCDQIYADKSKRVMVKKILSGLKREIPGVKSNLFNSLKKEIKTDYLL